MNRTTPGAKSVKVGNMSSPALRAPPARIPPATAFHHPQEGFGVPLQGVSGTLKHGHPTLRDAYISTNTGQTGSQSDATTARTALDGMVKAITDKRIAVQYAADAEWPYTNKANAGIRREFFLPTRRYNSKRPSGTEAAFCAASRLPPTRRR